MKTGNKMLESFGNAPLRLRRSFQCVTLFLIVCGIHFLIYIEAIDAVTRASTSSDIIIVTEETKSIESIYLYSDLIQERRRRLDENEKVTTGSKSDELEKSVQTTGADTKKTKKYNDDDELKKKNSSNKPSKAGKPKTKGNRIKSTSVSLTDQVTNSKTLPANDISRDKVKSNKKKSESLQSNEKNKSTTKQGTARKKDPVNCTASTCEKCAALAQRYLPDSGDTKPRKSDHGCYWHEGECTTVIIDANYTEQYVSTEALCKPEEDDKIQHSTEQKQQLCSNETECEKCHEVTFDKEMLGNDTSTCWWNGTVCELSNTTAISDTLQICAISPNSTVPIDIDIPGEDFCKNATTCTDCQIKVFLASGEDDKLCWWDWDGETCSSSDNHIFADLQKMCSANETIKPSNDLQRIDQCNTVMTCRTCQNTNSSLPDELCWWNGTNCNAEKIAVGLDPSIMCICADAKSCSNCTASSSNIPLPGSSTDSSMSCFWNETIHSCHLTDTVSLNISLDGMCNKTNGLNSLSVLATSENEQIPTEAPVTAKSEDSSLSLPDSEDADIDENFQNPSDDESNRSGTRPETKPYSDDFVNPDPDIDNDGPTSEALQNDEKNNELPTKTTDKASPDEASKIIDTDDIQPEDAAPPSPKLDVDDNEHDNQMQSEDDSTRTGSRTGTTSQQDNEVDEKSKKVRPESAATDVSQNNINEDVSPDDARAEELQEKSDKEGKELPTKTINKASTDEASKTKDTSDIQSDTVPKKEDKTAEASQAKNDEKSNELPTKTIDKVATDEASKIIDTSDIPSDTIPKKEDKTGEASEASPEKNDEKGNELPTTTIDKASTDETSKTIDADDNQSETVPKKEDKTDNPRSSDELYQPFKTGTNAIIFVALVSIAGYCLFRRCRSGSPINHQNGYRQQQKYEGISTQADDDEEWGWDESPSKSGKVTGMKLNSNSNSNLLHRSIPMDNTNGSHIRDKPRRTSSGQSHNSDKTIGIRDGVNYKNSAKPIRQVQSQDPDDFFEQMGLAAKPKFSVNNKPLQSSKEVKRLQPIMPAKPKIISPPAVPPQKKINKLGATTLKSDSFDDMEDDDWGDDDKDLDDLLNN